MSALAKMSMKADAAQGARPVSVSAFLQDEESREIVESVLNERMWPADDIRVGKLEDAARYLTDQEPPEVLIVDLSSARNPAARVQLLSKLCRPGARIVGIGDVNDVDLYRQVLDAGLVDYLVKPLTRDLVNRAFDAEVHRPGTEGGSKGTHVVAIIGARGGVGATTVAVNVAWLAAHEYQRQTALLDLDLHFGTCSLSLDLLPGRGLREALEHPERIDNLFVQRAMVKESDNLMILSGEEALHESANVQGHGIEMLMRELQDNFEYVIIDMPRSVIVDHPDVLLGVQKAVVVSDLSLPGVRDSLRILSLIREAAPEMDVKVVANQVDRSRFDGLPASEFERGVAAKIDRKIPFDAKAVGNANKQGRAIPAVAGNSRMTKELRSLCTVLFESVKPVKKGFFGLKKAG